MRNIKEHHSFILQCFHKQNTLYSSFQSESSDPHNETRSGHKINFAPLCIDATIQADISPEVYTQPCLPDNSIFAYLALKTLI